MFGTEVPRLYQQQFSAATLWESRLTVRCRPGHTARLPTGLPTGRDVPLLPHRLSWGPLSPCEVEP